MFWAVSYNGWGSHKRTFNLIIFTEFRVVFLSQQNRFGLPDVGVDVIKLFLLSPRMHVMAGDPEHITV